MQAKNIQSSQELHLFKGFRRPLIEIMTDLRKPIKPRFMKHKIIQRAKNSLCFMVRLESTYGFLCSWI